MNRRILISILLSLFVIQLFVPAQMIYEHATTIESGTAYKFKTRPIDPTDPFRGKYIVLNYELDSFETQEDWNGYRGDVFVYLRTDLDGFATAKTVSRERLNTKDEYVIAKSSYNYDHTVHFDLPFDRFYMNEKKAYDAEISVRNAQRDTTKTCYALVFVKDGMAVLENVFIDGTPIQKFVDEYQESTDK